VSTRFPYRQLRPTLSTLPALPALFTDPPCRHSHGARPLGVATMSGGDQTPGLAIHKTASSHPAGVVNDCSPVVW
jgi:hypothetical protein